MTLGNVIVRRGATPSLLPLPEMGPGDFSPPAGITPFPPEAKSIQPHPLGLRLGEAEGLFVSVPLGLEAESLRPRLQFQLGYPTV